MTAEVFEHKAEAKLENLSGIIDFVIVSLKMLGVDDHSTFDIQLAVDEISVNIIKYAYGETGGSILTACRRDGNAIFITIMDDGRPFDPTHIPSPDLGSDLEHRKVGGLGVYLAKKVMDSVIYRYENGQNVLTMKKFIK
jgi:anti-sigma B factor antagonist/serine/threonine-protein kinase RsbW